MRTRILTSIAAVLKSLGDRLLARGRSPGPEPEPFRHHRISAYDSRNPSNDDGGTGRIAAADEEEFCQDEPDILQAWTTMQVVRPFLSPYVHVRAASEHVSDRDAKHTVATTVNVVNTSTRQVEQARGTSAYDGSCRRRYSPRTQILQLSVSKKPPGCVMRRTGRRLVEQRPGGRDGQQSLGLFHWRGTDLCAPTDADFREWLDGIRDHSGNGDCKSGGPRTQLQGS